MPAARRAGRDAIQESGEGRHQGQGGSYADENGEGRHCQTLANDHADQPGPFGAQRNANAHFLGALRDDVREDAVDSQRRQQQGQAGKDAEQDHRLAAAAGLAFHQLPHGSDVG